MNLEYRLAAGVDIHSGAEGRLFVSTPSERFIILDTFGMVRRVVEAIREKRSATDALEDLDQAQREAAVDQIIAMLRQRGLLSAEDTSPPIDGDPLLSWLQHISRGGETYGRVAVAGDGMLATMVADILREAGIRIIAAETAERSDLILGCFDVADTDAMRALNRRAIALGSALLFASLDRHIVTIGPTILPGATACFECYHHRSRAMREHSVTGIDAAHVSISPMAARLAAAHAASTALRLMAGAAFDLHVTTLDRMNILDGRSGTTVVLKLPRCPVCGRANATVPLAPTFAAVASAVGEAA